MSHRRAGALPEPAEDEAANAALRGNETVVTNNGDSKLLTRDEIIVGVENLQERLTLKGHTGAVLNVAFSPDEKQIVSGSLDETIKVRDVQSGQEIFTFQGHTESVFSVAFSPDGKSIVSGGKDGTLRLWNADARTDS